MIRSLFLSICYLAHSAAGVVTLPDPSSKMPEGGTVVWSPLFQATWDAMNTEMGGKPEKIEPPDELMTRLDAFRWEPEKVMPEGGWKTWAGAATPDFLKHVNAEAARLTGEAEGPFKLRGEAVPGSIACFGLLDREVEFEKRFYRSAKVPLHFGASKSPVFFFGTKGKIAREHREVVKVLAYRATDRSQALEISCKGADDKVILYLPAKPQDFATACTWIRQWRKEWQAGEWGGENDGRLHEGDELRVPYVSLDATADFSSQLTSGRFYGKPGDPWTIRRAEQKTKFELHEKGARVRVEASMEADPFGGEPLIVPRRFIYDRPFFVFLWREQAEWPYLAVWVGDTSALWPPFHKAREMSAE
jgi:hypothetical protein